MECQVIQKQMEYIKELERKIAILAPKEQEKDWSSIRNTVIERAEKLMNSNTVKGYALTQNITSIINKTLDIKTIVAVKGEQVDIVLDIANRIMDIVEEYIEKGGE
ncbi:hypothetical protein PBV87_02600 [Niameybacter massiliensis]|uniref:Uncharacterized protein n=1 Tax=Holtiella tumoricola TaxID=3018743 RepID=A0AA42DK08_9FIRM|nr:hypothetical protein [Holtiella tumoricola]MDA3730395.1 hypothetical protein [Holtiella tumoricola]